MPNIETKKVITFTEEEKEVINKIVDLTKALDCNAMDISCDLCPFGSICEYTNADAVEKHINKLLNF